MTLELWLAYVATTLALMSTPGPSHLLMLSNAMAHGFARSTATAAGDLSANVLQMLAAGFGLAALLLASEQAFGLVKWGGVGYLVWLGLRQIRRSFRPPGPLGGAAPASLRALWLQGFVTSAANPKAVVFFAALFPQFLAPERPLAPQLAILGATYVVVDGAFLSLYGLAAGFLARRLGGAWRAWSDRASGAALIVAAALLSLKTATRAG